MADDQAPNASGLSSVEARRRFQQDGPNGPVPAHRWSALRELLGFAANPLVLILMIAAFASVLLGSTRTR